MTVAMIQARCDMLRTMAKELAGAELPSPEREKVVALATIGISLLESLLVDICRISTALEGLETTYRLKSK